MPNWQTSLLPFPSSGTKSRKPSELIYSDICDPTPNSFLSRSRYYATFINVYSRFVWIFFMKEKSEMFEIFVRFRSFAKNHFQSKIKKIPQ